MMMLDAGYPMHHPAQVSVVTNERGEARYEVVVAGVRWRYSQEWQAAWRVRWAESLHR